MPMTININNNNDNDYDKNFNNHHVTTMITTINIMAVTTSMIR